MFFLPQKTLNGASYMEQQADVSDLSKMLFSRNLPFSDHRVLTDSGSISLTGDLSLDPE